MLMVVNLPSDSDVHGVPFPGFLQFNLQFYEKMPVHQVQKQQSSPLAPGTAGDWAAGTRSSAEECRHAAAPRAASSSAVPWSSGTLRILGLDRTASSVLRQSWEHPLADSKQNMRRAIKKGLDSFQSVTLLTNGLPGRYGPPGGIRCGGGGGGGGGPPPRGCRPLWGSR